MAKLKRIIHLNRIFKISTNIYGITLLRIVLGGVLIVAGIAKLPYINSLIWEIQQYKILPERLIPVFARVLPPIEIIVGTLLMTGMFSKINSLGSAWLLIGFTITKASAFLRGLEINTCPCFGPSVILHSKDSLVLGLLMLVFSILVFLFDRTYLASESVVNLLSEKRKTSRINSD
jgi:uncharacterized membrane protein YphA (DoxX/SURF4 family)